MSRMAAKGTGRQQSRFQKLRLLGSFVLSFVLILGVYYFFYVEKKSSYLVSRNFRFLAAMGAQIRDSLSSQETVLENLTKKDEFVTVLKKPVAQLSSGDRQKRRAILESLAPRFENVEVDGDNKSDPAAQPHPEPYELRLENGEYVLDFSVLPAPDTGQGGNGKTVPDEKHLHGTISLTRLLEPLRPGDAFESVLLANEEGKVFYQKGASDLGTAHLAALLATAEGQRRPSPAVEGEGRPERPASETADDHRLPFFSASDFRDVRLSGREYRLFVEPVLLRIWERQEAKSAPTVDHRDHRNDRHVWLVCGLAPRRNLFYQSFAVSSALVGSILGLLALTVFSWPFVKLSLLGDRQRVHVFDVLLLGVCSLLGVAVLTLFLSDVFAYEGLRGISEAQIQELADAIEVNLRTEIALGYQQLDKLEEREELPLGGEERERANMLASGAFTVYPFADTFMVLDDFGMQRRKWSTNAVVPPKIPVDFREYFKRSRQGETWQVPDPRGGPSVGPFVLQSTVGLTDGTRAGVIAKPARRGSGYSVAALSLPMISVIDPVLPPGFEFAVIDNDQGQVLFHSDRQRNLTENFFDETDHDRRLRAAVFARRPETLGIRYWGEDYLARVTPVQGMPWTVVALRDQRMLRAVNVDWITAAALFVGLYLGTVALALALFAIARPSYRAPWLWPNPACARDYLQLAAGLALLAVAFAWIIQLARGEALLWAGFLVPTLGWSVAYLKLGAPGNNKRVVCGVGLLCLLFLLDSVLEGSGAGGPWHIAQALGSFLLILAGCTVALLSPESRPWLRQLGQRIHHDRALATHTYPAAGVLLLALTAVLPTGSFFKVAHDVKFENLVKHGQLRLLKALEQRESRARREYNEQRGDRKGDHLADRLAVRLDIYAKPFFDTRVYLPCSTAGKPGACESWQGGVSSTRRIPAGCTGQPARSLFSEPVESLMPPSSEYAREMHELLHEGAVDRAWHWDEEDGDRLVLHAPGYAYAGEVRLVSLRDGSTPRPGSAGGAATQARKAGFALAADDLDWSRRHLLLALAALALVAILLLGLLYVVLFIARKVFLLDVREPLWSAKQGEQLQATMGSNLFLISRAERWNLDEKNFFQLHFKDLEGDRSAWACRRLERVRSPTDQNILVKGFEYKIEDEAFNEVKLGFLEDLLQEDQGTVVVQSTVSPFAQERPRESWSRMVTTVRVSADLKQRWYNLLASFTLIDLDLRESVEGSPGQPLEGRGAVLWQESGKDPFLQRIAEDLKKQSAGMDRQQLLEEFEERAESRYRAIWASCSRDEQVVLEHLAEEGFVNEKNRRLVRRLMVRGLVQRAPNLRLFNETFRRFVASATCRREVLDLERRAAPSAWDQFRWPFFVGLSAAVAFFFATQQALFDGTMATITGLAAGLPALVKLLGFLGGGRGSERSSAAH
jgi:hypothetical protein